MVEGRGEREKQSFKRGRQSGLYDVGRKERGSAKITKNKRGKLIKIMEDLKLIYLKNHYKILIAEKKRILKDLQAVTWPSKQDVIISFIDPGHIEFYFSVYSNLMRELEHNTLQRMLKSFDYIEAVLKEEQG